MRKIIIALTAFAMLFGFTASGSAQEAPTAVGVSYGSDAHGSYIAVTQRIAATPGHHNNTFYSCTVDNRRAKIYIKYEVNAVSGSDVQIEEVLYETAWGGHPAFLGNAVRADVKAGAGAWVEWSPAWGGSSATLDDMPSYYNVIYLGEPALVMNTSITDYMRVRFYGVGKDAVENRCDDSYTME